MIGKFKKLNELVRQLYLHEVIEILTEECNKTPDLVLSFGFGNPHSWRGDYCDLAFEPKENVPIKEMLSDAKKCIGMTFTGYKGGEFTMADYTQVWFDYYGEYHDIPMSRIVLKRMLEGKE